MNKNILEKLMELDSKKADVYLAKFANEIKSKISRNKDNDEIFKNLELLEEFVYKVSDQALVIVNMVIKDKKSNKVKIHRGGFPGKDYKDLVSKCISLLEKIRYIKPLEVFEILVSLHSNENEQIKAESTKVLAQMAKYDFYALKHIGYGVQRKLLDIVLRSWKKQKRIDSIEIIKIIAKELLKPSFKGVSMKDYKTMVFKSGELQPTKFLKKIRRDTIELLFFLYNQNEDIKTKINLLEILYGASDFPHYDNYGEKVIKMITDDVSYLVNTYEKIVFGKGSKIITDAPVTQEIERQLVWFNKRHKNKLPKIPIFLEKIRKNKFYDLYRILIGDTLRLDRIEKESLQKAKEEGGKKIDTEFKKIKKTNIKKWNKKLNSIAKYKDVIDEWKFSRFNGFLQSIAGVKPELAKIILDDAFENNKPLKAFTNQFLFGFRRNNSLKIWDDYVEKIVKEKNINLVKDVANSFFHTTDLKNIRKKDIDLLSQIIKKEKPFDFLKKVKKSELLNLNFSSIRILLHIYRKDKKQIEKLIKTLIESDKDKRYLYMYLEQLGFPTYRNEIDLSEWSKENIKFILDKLVELKNLKYETQLLLLAIAKNDFSSAMNVFVKRIRKRDKIMKQKKGWILSTEYDAIPYHFNKELSEYINQKKESIKIIEGWVEKMSSKSYMYNIELAQFLQRIGGSIFNKILLKIVKKGDEKNLNRGISLMWGISSPNFDICFEIIKKTDDKKIWKRLGGLMFNTGVVGGEYGIAIAHEKKVKEIRKCKVKGTEKEKKRVEKFKKEIIKSLEKTAKQERQRAEEDIKLRKLEFEK